MGIKRKISNLSNDCVSESKYDDIAEVRAKKNKNTDDSHSDIAETLVKKKSKKTIVKKKSKKLLVNKSTELNSYLGDITETTVKKKKGRGDDLDCGDIADNSLKKGNQDKHASKLHCSNIAESKVKTKNKRGIVSKSANKLDCNALAEIKVKKKHKVDYSESNCDDIVVTNVKKKTKEEILDDESHEKKRIEAAKLRKKKKFEIRQKNKQRRALEYLDKWESDRFNWLFNKINQKWLLKNFQNEIKVPEKNFTCLLKYLVGLKGMGRINTIKNAEAILETNKELDDEQRERYHKVLQVLKEE